MKNTRKRIDLEARVIHTRISINLRLLMSRLPEGERGIMTVARNAGVGVGSIQSILDDPDHSPSVRVLGKLVKFFKLDGIGDLTDTVPEAGADE